MEQNSIEEYKRRKAFALEYGTFLGISWIVVFAAYICGLRTMNPLLMMCCYAGLAVLLYLPFYFVLRFKNRHTDASQTITYGQAIHFTILMFSYAIVLTGIAEYIYFAFLDNGAVFDTLLAFVNDPQLDNSLIELNIQDMKHMMVDNIEAMRNISALDIALSLMHMNVTISLILTFIVAAVMKKQPK